MKNKLVEIISDAVVQCRYKEAKGFDLTPVQVAVIITNSLIAQGVTILPEGAMVLTRKELDALKEYGKRRKNEKNKDNFSHC